MITLEEIIKRYNQSVANAYEAKIFASSGNSEKEQEYLRYACESMSETLEFALKYHLIQHGEDLKGVQKWTTPQFIEYYYYDINKKEYINKGLQPLSGVKPSVNFKYMYDRKWQLINDAKHEGGVVDRTVYVTYRDNVKAFIKQYIDKDADLKNEDYYSKTKFDDVIQFYASCDRFSNDERIFILLTNNKPTTKELYRAFGRVDWKMVVEFDKDSLKSGFCAGAYSDNEITHIYTTSDNIVEDTLPNYSKTPLVFFANGYQHIPSFENPKDWVENYYQNLDNMLMRFAVKYTSQKTIVVSLLQDPKLFSQVSDLICRRLTNVTLVVANDPQEKLTMLCDNSLYSENIIHTNITLSQMDTCFCEYLCNTETSGTEKQIIKLPCLSNEVSGIISRENLTLIEEYFDILYQGIDLGDEDEEEDFLIGKEMLTWQGAKRKFAAEHPKAYRAFIKTLDREVRKGHGLVSIVHEPGYGGSTIMRMLAQYFHSEYPVLILKRYNYQKVKELLDVVYKATKKSLMIFAEIPASISMEDLQHLLYATNQAQPYLFIAVRRGWESTDSRSLVLPDWGNDAVLLKDKFLPYIEKQPMDRRVAKENEIENIISGRDREVYKRTPFYFGWLAFEENFAAMDAFIDHFVEAVSENEAQRKALIYIAISDLYISKPLPDAFLKVVFSISNDVVFHLENCFNAEDGILTSLLTKRVVDGSTYRSLRYPYFAKQLLVKLLNVNGDLKEDEPYANLGNYCRTFIDDCKASSIKDYMQDEYLNCLFISSSKERADQKFTKIFENILKEERVLIFKSLYEKFPTNPHYASHLARYYSIEEKNMTLAIKYADLAISLSVTPDPILYHIKAMCLFSIISHKTGEILSNMKKGVGPLAEDVDDIINNLFVSAQYEFKRARDLQVERRHQDEYVYIPNVRLILTVFDFAVQVKGMTKADVISKAIVPYINWIDEAQALLEDTRRLYTMGEETERYIEAQSDMWEAYGDLSNAIYMLNNKLTEKTNLSVVRRQLVRLYMQKSDVYKTNVRENQRLLDMMEKNMLSEPMNERNFYLWFMAARYSQLELDEILSKITMWRAINPSQEITFYCYVLNCIKAIEGSSESAAIANKLLGECKGTDDIRIREWYGGDYPNGIINHRDYSDNPDQSRLYAVRGIITNYIHPGAAEITMDSGLKVFFKPTENNLTESCRNKEVEFCLGFSYDGMRAMDGSVSTEMNSFEQ